MFCETCGFEVEEDDSFCRKCGAAVGPSGAVEAPRACTRRPDGRMVAGVCVGVASYWNKDVTLVRIVWTLSALIPPLFPGVVAYLVSWLLMPASSKPEVGTQPPMGKAVTSD